MERTNRPINKSAILGNLEALLTREVEAGNFMRVAEDTYSLPPLPPSTYQPPTSLPMPVATPPLPTINIPLSHHSNLGTANPGQPSMMSVPMTPLLPSTPIPTPPPSSQPEQHGQELIQPLQNPNVIPTQSNPSLQIPSTSRTNQKLPHAQFASQIPNSQPYYLTSQTPSTHPMSSTNTMIGSPSHQFPLTPMIRQADSLTPDSRSPQQQRLQSASMASSDIVSSPELPLTPPPLTIHTPNSLRLPSSSLANIIHTTNIISSAATSTLGTSMLDGGNLPMMQPTSSSDLDLQTSMQVLSQQSQPMSLHQQGNPNLLISQQYHSHNMTPTSTVTPPPHSASLHQRHSMSNQTEHMINISQTGSPSHMTFQHVSQPPNQGQASTLKGEKSDEEKKNDLINEKLFKLNSFQGNKGQSPSRPRSIEKGDGQKNKIKKIKEKQTTCGLLKDDEEGKLIGSIPAIVKQEVPSGVSCSSSQHGNNTFTSMPNNIKAESKTDQPQTYLDNDDVNLQDISTVNNVECFTVKVEPFLTASAAPSEQKSDTNLGNESANQHIFLDSGLGNVPSNITKQRRLGYNEFAIPGESKTTTRNGTGVRKKVSNIRIPLGITYIMFYIYLLGGPSNFANSIMNPGNKLVAIIE